MIRMADNKLAKELGRKPTQLEKEPLRPMYSRYWKIKRRLQDGSNNYNNNTNKSNEEQSLIIELLKY